jgi:short-subunit dehydrogenase
MGSSGKTALITGASAGLGLEFAKLVAEDGHDLVLVARREERLRALAAELTARHGVTVTVLGMDLAQRSTPKQIAEAVQAAGITVDYLINNAGFGSHGPFASTELGRQLEMVDVNVRGLVELTHLFLAPMLARKHGRILNVASVAAFVPGPLMASYYASKAFVLSFSEALSAELHGTGVTVTAWCPGPTATEFGKVANSDRKNLLRRRVADAAQVARHGYRAMLAGKSVAIPGTANKVNTFLPRIGPRWLLRRVMAWFNRKRG